MLEQVAVWQGRSVYVFTRPGDHATRDFARSLGAGWAGGADETPLPALDAAILFAPMCDLVPLALQAVRNGGRVVCGPAVLTVRQYRCAAANRTLATRALKLDHRIVLHPAGDARRQQMPPAIFSAKDPVP